MSAFTPDTFLSIDGSGLPSTAEIFAIVALCVVTAAAGGIVMALAAPRPERLEACGSLFFAGWFSAGVSLQLDRTPWTAGGVLTLPWMIVCSFTAASLVLALSARRIARTVYSQLPEEDQ